MSVENENLDWSRAEQYLKECEAAYSSAGSSGMFALSVMIAPLRDRFNRGGRTHDLYEDIYGIEL